MYMCTSSGLERPWRPYFFFIRGRYPPSYTSGPRLRLWIWSWTNSCWGTCAWCFETVCIRLLRLTICIGHVKNKPSLSIYCTFSKSTTSPTVSNTEPPPQSEAKPLKNELTLTDTLYNCPDWGAFTPPPIEKVRFNIMLPIYQLYTAHTQKKLNSINNSN